MSENPTAELHSRGNRAPYRWDGYLRDLTCGFDTPRHQITGTLNKEWPSRTSGVDGAVLTSRDRSRDPWFRDNFTGNELGIWFSRCRCVHSSGCRSERRSALTGRVICPGWLGVTAQGTDARLGPPKCMYGKHRKGSWQNDELESAKRDEESCQHVKVEHQKDSRPDNDAGEF